MARSSLRRWAATVVAVVVLGQAAAAAAEGADGGGDGEALMAVKAGFGNAANALADWDGGRDHCAWRGVACDDASFAVLSLNLSNLNLGGEISPAIGEQETRRQMAAARTQRRRRRSNRVLTGVPSAAQNLCTP